MKGFMGSGLLVAVMAAVILSVTSGARADWACPCADFYLTQVAQTFVVVDTIYTYDTNQQHGDYDLLCIIAPGGDDDLPLSTVYGYGDGPAGTGIYRLYLMDPAGEWEATGDFVFLDTQ